MSKYIVTPKLNNTRKTFTAIFDKYEFKSIDIKSLDNKIWFIKLRDENNKLLKKSYFIDGNKYRFLIGDLSPGRKVTFKGSLAVNETNPNEFTIEDLDWSYNYETLKDCYSVI